MSIADQSCAQAPSEATLRHGKLSRISARIQNLHNFSIVGAWLNFGFTEMRQPDISRLLDC